MKNQDNPGVRGGVSCGFRSLSGRRQPADGHVEAERGQIEDRSWIAKNHTVVYAAAGDSVKVTVDGIDGDGKPAHNEWTGKFDGRITRHRRSQRRTRGRTRWWMRTRSK